ncbi:cysteinyl-tRNA synthetase [Patellaria atrata CBS 101060]|uniref:cysteine--tRNA ligase n=1 Tax=Patellaria atrata CBS 101060 TaxID=1346257 RepID=A0A9P4VPW3_9PEZI|nr:cysteinyl-tRNA synthetase [Patellaria atrata CBS 101060]
MATVRQPPWQAPAPTNAKIPEIRIYNSLTRQKELFVPSDDEGKKITWYACGPTVYDDAHLGHARNYVTTDIIRRILKDYFKFDVKFVMNITDVDDKIIIRGRQQHLLSEFTSKHVKLDDEVISTAQAAFKAYIKKNLVQIDAETQPHRYESVTKQAYAGVLEGKSLEGSGKPPGDKEAKVKMHIKTAASAAEVLQSASKGESLDLTEFYTKTQDVLLPYLDQLYGSSLDIRDYSIFSKLTTKYENRFMEDVRALNVLDADLITRVTEYSKEIAEFVDKIVNNKFAYATSDGSVYFDIAAFEKAGNSYARLEPWSRGDKELQADGEGALTKKSTEKRSDADFALWKASKPGEPSWPSPWGRGRPGWHIECSAMASDVLGPKMDIHSGGIDLAFPHHDNELAQSEAYWHGLEQDHSHQHQWVNYFLHMGHLSIQGSKMSKSLKNFTTIREALERGEWNARSLRIVFLFKSWKDGIEITDDLVKEGIGWEYKVNNFFLKAKDLERNPSYNTPSVEHDSALAKALSEAQHKVDEALRDSFNTRDVMRAISNIITEYNTLEKNSLTDETILTVARWITQLVTTLGLDGKADLSDPNRVGWSGIDIPEAAVPLVYPLSRLRDEVRKNAIAGITSPELLTTIASKDQAAKLQEAETLPYAEVLTQFQEDVRNFAEKGASAKELLQLCDQLRDVKLWDLGIYLEDREGQPAMVRPVDQELVAAREAKVEKERKKLADKQKREHEEAEKAAKKAERAKLSHLEMFRTSEYSAWDDEGLPLRDAKGDEIPKNRTKKLKKEWVEQKKLHEQWKTANSGPSS